MQEYKINVGLTVSVKFPTSNHSRLFPSHMQSRAFGARTSITDILCILSFYLFLRLL